jgi:hypothetical protein
MPPQNYRLPAIQLLTCLLLVALGSSGCGASQTPSIRIETELQTVVVTQEVTRVVTSAVTVEEPVTVTPSPTPQISLTPSNTPTLTLTPTVTRTPTITLTPSITPTPHPPVVTILVHAACLFGPGAAYLWDYGLNATSWMQVIGRSPSNPNTDPEDIWLWVEGVDGWNPCWVKNEFVKFNDGLSLQQHPEIPIVSYTILPLSTLYRNPTGVTATRRGTKVYIYWNPVWMTTDDYRGYLVEAWLCQDGQLTFTPIGVGSQVDYAGNSGLQGIVVTDEPGCLFPSSARVYAVEKHGYTAYTIVPWPPYEATPTPTPIP